MQTLYADKNEPKNGDTVKCINAAPNGNDLPVLEKGRKYVIMRSTDGKVRIVWPDETYRWAFGYAFKPERFNLVNRADFNKLIRKMFNGKKK